MDGCQLAEAPPCPLITIRREFPKSKPWQEDEESARARARKTDDLDANRTFNLWHPDYAKADKLHASTLSSGGAKHAKDLLVAKAKGEIKVMQEATLHGDGPKALHAPAGGRGMPLEGGARGTERALATSAHQKEDHGPHSLHLQPRAPVVWRGRGAIRIHGSGRA